MQRLSLIVLILLSILLPVCAEQLPSTGTTEVFFSPKGGATAAVVRELDSARAEVFVQAYSFTSKPIAKALVDAKKRGLKVEVVLDRIQCRKRYSSADFFSDAGIPTYIDNRHPMAHNKIMIIDGQTVITGSFNFTRDAEEKYAENLLVLKGNKPLLERYLKNFENHKGHSNLYARRGE